MQPGLFREKALSRLSSPEQLDQAMRVTSPRAWLAFLGLAALIAGALVWGLVGSVPSTIAGRAVVINRGSKIYDGDPVELADEARLLAMF